jgi:cellobiose phosphorylase
MKIKNSSGFTIEFLENGSVKSIEFDPIRINLKAGSIYSDPGTNIYLRKRGRKIDYHPLTGPGSNSRFQIVKGSMMWEGEWLGINYACILQLAAESLGWLWNIDLKNSSDESLELDLVYLQDAGLKPVNAGLLNEYYIAQYLERRILEDPVYGSVVCCRQNMKESTGHPWFMIACRNSAISGSADGMQFYGKTYRETGIPEGLLAERMGGEYAGESPVVALQEKPFKLAAGESHNSVFIATYMPDHPLATTEKDLKRLPGLIDEMESRSLGTPSQISGTPSQFLPVEDLTNDELTRFFGKEWRHVETVNDRLLSFFNNENNHIVLRSKEIMADRPHAHIMQAKTGFVPNESIVSTTSFMFGVFNSHITQGNTNFNVLLSICTSQFNTDPETGQRIHVEIGGRKYMLGVPSAFEIGLNHCRWIYKHGDFIFQVRTWTSKVVPQVNMDFKVINKETGRQEDRETRGDKVKLIITHDFDPLNGWKVAQGKKSNEFIALPNPESMIKGKFDNARFRLTVQSDVKFKAYSDETTYPGMENPGSSLFVLEAEETHAFCISFIGEVCATFEMIKIVDADQQFHSDCRVAWTEWRDLSLNLLLESEQEDIAAIREILPWYGMNALTHFITPYGLEQFSGAAWGTRDVSQGPIDFLLTLEKYEEARKILLIIFSNQNPDGGWPQWWMFDSYREIRAHDSHGDVYYWCLIALANYIKVTGDLEILDEILPYYYGKGDNHAEKTPLREHIDRLITMINGSFIPGTSLAPFGGGDWNDSLQPVSKELARRMISSWTVEMNYQAYRQYQSIYEMTGEHEKANRLNEICGKIRSDFNNHLVKDGIVAGYGLVEDNGMISVLLHPSDLKTGIQYSALPMERGILSGIFTKEQALHHLDLIEKHLKGPDGARLMDRPLKYRGGIQEIFQRAESSTFFGREIGLMYVHEHIRYAESLAKTGKADAFVNALRQAIPVNYRDAVPCGDIRQANCYYSSSDVHFQSRYEADKRYDEVLKGNFTLRGGWRVYSSGPGIYIGLIVTKLLGIRIESGNVIIDPVLPFSMDGLEASMDFMEYPVKFRYAVKEGNFSPRVITINGENVPFYYEENMYRKGGAMIPVGQFADMMNEKENLINIVL